MNLVQQTVNIAKHSINKQTYLILGILFSVYVVGDLVTTIWLIQYYPGGIEGESNPFGGFIYSQIGIFGLIFTKITMFLIISTSVFTIKILYKNERKMASIIKHSIHGLIGWSSIIVTVNIIQITRLAL